MLINVAMSNYFVKLKKLYREMFGTAPTFPWEENSDHGLFISLPDEDGDAQWNPKMAAPLNDNVAGSLCTELRQFYSSWYFLQLRGRIKNIDIDFFPFYSVGSTIRAINTALKDGNDYFPGENCVLLATCTVSGIDDMLLFYKQTTGELFIYDPDTRKKHAVKSSLSDLIANMEALI